MATKQIALRLEETLLERLDEMIAALKEDPEYRVLDINRSVAIRMLVERGLLAWELRLNLEQEDWYKLDEATFEFWARRAAEWSRESYRMGHVQREWVKRARASGFWDRMTKDSERRARMDESMAEKFDEGRREAQRRHEEAAKDEND